uniref:Uncharacterized protein n=1 Tax=Globodera rostochiensis TaxID=31243 RepID=A0A914HQF4_GLORO
MLGKCLRELSTRNEELEQQDVFKFFLSGDMKYIVAFMGHRKVQRTSPAFFATRGRANFAFLHFFDRWQWRKRFEPRVASNTPKLHWLHYYLTAFACRRRWFALVSEQCIMHIHSHFRLIGSSNQRVKAEKNEQLIKMEKFGNHSKGKSSSAKNHQKIRASTSTSSSSLECQVNSSDDDYVASLSEEEADSEDNSSDLEVTDDEELYDSSASKSLASSSLTNHQGREKLKKKSKSNENVDNSREMLIIKQFDKLKEERVKKNKFANRAQIDAEIAHELGVSRRTIYLWKKKLGLRCKKLCYPQKDKRIILQRFEKMKKEYKEKLIASSCYEIEIKIAKELGVNRSTITDWRKEFGLNKWRTYTEVEKLELIGKYREMKNRNPHLPYCKIAAKLNVLQRTILRWIQEFRNKKEHETTTTTADFDSKDGSLFIRGSVSG